MTQARNHVLNKFSFFFLLRRIKLVCQGNLLRILEYCALKDRVSIRNASHRYLSFDGYAVFFLSVYPVSYYLGSVQ